MREDRNTSKDVVGNILRKSKRTRLQFERVNVKAESVVDEEDLGDVEIEGNER